MPNWEQETEKLAKFKQDEASRPALNPAHEAKFFKTVNPDWQPGDGASNKEWQAHGKTGFGPYDAGRPAVDNYKLLVSAIVPRPIGFISTVSADGTNFNLAPYSFFQIVSSNPPTFCLSVSGNPEVNKKDTLANILQTKEATLNVVSDWIVDAANYSSITSPPEVDEWVVTGLHRSESVKVAAPHVAESAFSIEVKLTGTHEIKSPITNTVSSVVLFLEAVYFHARNDIINHEQNYLDIAKLRPIARLGGTQYGRINEVFEIPRFFYDEQLQTNERLQDLQQKD
ncbi:hypothetical protein V1514DRAFT_335434 [Lipomyces japonicus]|uniref:uncharacterized protein n=1 Tax=Lipomyces japonicus TaxID=56871 RepID=UPI0034CE9CF0